MRWGLLLALLTLVLCTDQWISQDIQSYIEDPRNLIRYTRAFEQAQLLTPTGYKFKEVPLHSNQKIRSIKTRATYLYLDTEFTVRYTSLGDTIRIQDRRIVVRDTKDGSDVPVFIPAT
jgi:hypothetical protein